MWNIPIWLFIVLIIVAILAGAVTGFFLAKNYFKKYLEKNPPINEQMVRAMMSQMGRKPSEKQVRQVMASIKQAK
ncbi:MAG: YneF family protein [Candidatus Izemoplasmatales bacterium]|nr:YneF family protein [Candidatus Izemoplasmatales bacterium]